LEQFKKDTIIDGGTKEHPYHKEIGEYKCISCKVDAKVIKKKACSNQQVTMRGKLNTDWNEITIKCPKCKKQETYDTHHMESDGNYYSNEERRVYNL